MNPPARPCAGLAQRREETFPVLLVAEDRLSPIPPVEHVIERTAKLHTRFSGHPPLLPRPLSLRQERNYEADPYLLFFMFLLWRFGL